MPPLKLTTLGLTPKVIRLFPLRNSADTITNPWYEVCSCFTSYRGEHFSSVFILLIPWLIFLFPASVPRFCPGFRA